MWGQGYTTSPNRSQRCLPRKPTGGSPSEGRVREASAAQFHTRYPLDESRTISPRSSGDRDTTRCAWAVLAATGPRAAARSSDRPTRGGPPQAARP